MNTNPPESDDPICEECDMPMHQWAFDGMSGWACSGCGWSFDHSDADDGSTIEPVEIPSTLSPITAAVFKEATGRDPTHDDLERCNCAQAGQVGHWMCGWNNKRNRPVFEVGYV